MNELHAIEEELRFLAANMEYAIWLGSRRRFRGLGSLNRTYSLSNSPEAVWSTVVHRLGIPAVPEWARRMSELFEEKERITVPDCIGYKALVVTATVEEVLQWLEELILQDELRLPDKNGPIVWPHISMKSVMRSQLASV